MTSLEKRVAQLEKDMALITETIVKLSEAVEKFLTVAGKLDALRPVLRRPRGRHQ